MITFRVFLAAVFLTVAVYTSTTVSLHGLDLFAVFFGDIAKLGWPGQFNLDFLMFLLMSGLWLAWRHDFSALGLGLGLLGVFGGSPFLSAYLLAASFSARGDMRVLLLGKRRAGAI